MTAETITHSPMMQQWHLCKSEAKDALLLFRLGDFYEAFYQDAEIIAKDLHLTLTQRQQIPMCGVPSHSLETYLDKLIAKGYKVAIAEQMEDPKAVKGLVKREIVRIVSPGALIQSSLLAEKANNFFLSIAQIGRIFGLALIDLSTGEFRLVELEKKEELLNEIFRLKPAEILVSEKGKKEMQGLFQELSHSLPFSLNTVEDFRFDPSFALDMLLTHFQVHSLDGFGLQGKVAGILAAGALLSYVKDDLRMSLSSVRTLQTSHLHSYMMLDRATLTHLNILPSSHGEKKHTLLHFLDHTETPMGGRLLARWVGQPLLSSQQISARQNAVAEVLQRPDELFAIVGILSQIRDLERLMTKISGTYATPKDLLSLAHSLQAALRLKQTLLSLKTPLLAESCAKIEDLSELISIIQKALVDDPPVKLAEGRTFREGHHPELDEWKKISQGSLDWMAAYQNRLRDASQIKTLKVGYTKAFGYYIEISRGQAEKAPPSFIRRQTLTNAERFVTEELREFEEKILVAEEKIERLEAELFQKLKEKICSFREQIQKAAEAAAQVDVLCSLARAALENRLVRPVVDESDQLIIQKGRHPIIEKSLPKGTFIANDVHLDTKERLYLITGPNMAGKSTYIRQVALIAILAQIGSFVPAEMAHIGIIDRVFSRIGASDDLARGQSTFMVEMTETAHILHHATNRSLIILDEIGRGTSTYDGIAIAWAVAEFLLTTEGKKGKTLFATHYSELAQMEGKISGAVNYQVAVKETASDIVFLRKIVKGSADRSYGIHVAKLAGLPYAAVKRAEELLLSLEKEDKKKPKKAPEEQLSFFSNPLLEEIKALDLNRMTPIEAHQFLQKWTKKD